MHGALSTESGRWLAIGTIIIAPLTTSAEIHVGTVTDGPGTHNEAIRNVFEHEVLALTQGEFDVVFPSDKQLEGDWTMQGIKEAADRLLADGDVDILLALGILSSTEVCRRGPLPKPVVAPLVIDSAVQGLPQQDGMSGVRNLVYLTSPAPFKQDLKAFNELVPFTDLAILGPRPLMEAVPELRDNCMKVVGEMGFRLEVVPVGDAAEVALGAIPANTEAVYMAPMLHLSQAEFGRLVAGLIEKRLPSFSMWGREDVERGVLATVSPAGDMQRLARRTALYVHRMLLGEDFKTLPVEFSRHSHLIINMATARSIGFSPTWSALTEAELLHQERAVAERRLTLKTVVSEAVRVNLDLLAADRGVAAGAEDIREARANLLPRIEVSTAGLIIDRDRAMASMGLQAERTWTGLLTLRQVIYAEPAWANLEAQRHLQRARELDRERLRLDIALEAAKAYLNVLRAKTYERIQKDNLERTRAHLETAQVRRTIGIASPAEVYRWESEIATSRKAVIEVEAKRRMAEIALNRLLCRPQEEVFATADITPEDTRLVADDNPIISYLDTPATFEVFRDFLVREGLAAAPELQQFDEAMAALERGVLSKRRAFYVPAVGLEGELTERISQGGAGAGGEFPLPLLLPTRDDTDWHVGIQASLPLHVGGARKAALIRAEEQLAQLRLERAAAAAKLEQWIRSASLAARASNAAIEQSRLAADAAHKNLELVSDAYGHGLVSIIELLDAQTASLVGEQLAANAVFDFILDVMEVQRASNTFEFFMDGAEINAWIGRLEACFDLSGVYDAKVVE